MTRFKTGQPSPNPAGRPRGRITRFRKLIGDLTGDGKEIAEGLRAIYLDPQNPVKDRLAAYELLLHYLLGKPETNVSIEADVTARPGPALSAPRILAQLSTEALREVIELSESAEPALLEAGDAELVDE